MTPFFSIVVPLFNKENYVRKTITSILNQTFSDFELLIISDCSTDSSLEKAKSIHDPRIKIIEHQKNKGLSASRNTGILHARASYITFLDADDLWKPDFLNEIHTLITKFPEASIFGTDFEFINTDKKNDLKSIPTKQNTPNVKRGEYGIIDDFFASSLINPIYCHSSVCFKKDVFDKIGSYDENITFAEDVDFNIRANTHFKLAYYNHACVQYLMFSQNQITNSDFSNKKIPDLMKYEPLTTGFPSLKKYLDYHRYVFANNFRLAGKDSYRKIIREIDPDNLNLKQKLLLRFPVRLVKKIKSLKQLLMKMGYQVSSFD